MDNTTKKSKTKPNLYENRLRENMLSVVVKLLLQMFCKVHQSITDTVFLAFISYHTG